MRQSPDPHQLLLAERGVVVSYESVRRGWMQRFKSPVAAQCFLSAHGQIYAHFRPRRHLMVAANYRRARAKAFRIWQQET